LVLENAARRAGRKLGGNAVVACNAEVATAAAELLREAGMRVEVAANVMPELGRLEVEPAREAILRAFLDHVIGGKGLSASPEFERMVRMPTPEAVLEATGLLGDAVVVDVGGATTDVHSSRTVEAAAPGIEDPLLPPPPLLRTVEGDLGLRAGAAGVAAADGRWLSERTGGEEAAIRQAVSIRKERPAWIPETPEELRFDALLASAAAAQALVRHCGTMLLSRGEGGPPTLVRDGPDLREIPLVLGTGGVFVHREDGESILREALDRRAPRSLAPRSARIAIDRGYLLAPLGLLSTVDRRAARRLAEREFGLSKN
jgi:uncharacterized protein (TIGR01319 family)